MRPVWIEKTKPEELEEAFAWLRANTEKNNIDWDAVGYQATTMLTAKDAGKNLLHLPVQAVYLLESLGISPDASPLDVAKSLYAVIAIARWESQKAGQSEIYFVGSCKETNELAEKHGFERVNSPVYRLRV